MELLLSRMKPGVLSIEPGAVGRIWNIVFRALSMEPLDYYVYNM